MTEPSAPYLQRRGFCLILSSPSGAGKTTLAKALLQADPELVLSVSVTTRPPRPQETHGIDYLFIEKSDFPPLRDAGGFIEWAEVFGHFYGTPAGPLRDTLASGRDVICDVDWQGADAISRALPIDAVRVFILPPSRDELIRRLNARGSDAADVIAKRLAGADEELLHWDAYDYVLVHHHVGESIAALQAIVAAERLKRVRQWGLSAFVRTIMKAD